MDLLAKLNSLPMFLIVGVVVAFIAALCVVFLVRSWRAGVALGMDKARLRRAITSSATFTCWGSSPCPAVWASRCPGSACR